MPDEWTEVNLVPHTMQDRIRVLLDVIEPLVHNELDGRIDTWFFGHYGDPAPYHLRVRILWRDEANANEGQRELSDFLDAQKRNREIDDWYPGSHGYRNQQYPGEADDFGTEMWEATYKLWGCQSEFALALLKNESQDSLSKHPFVWHWERAVHLFTNRLFLGIFDEIYLTLRQAAGYFNRFAQDTQNFNPQQRTWLSSHAQTIESIRRDLVATAGAALDEKILKDFRGQALPQTSATRGPGGSP
jgi:thiopeptide-type bacteriocin biosynthesis protein